jgi:hypothetical protein
MDARRFAMRKTGTIGLRAIALVSLLCTIAAAQQGTGAITIEGLDGTKLAFTVDQLRQMPQQSVSIVNPHTKATEKYGGVLLADLLAMVNTPSGDKLRGDEMRDYVEVTGRDGYQAVFALAELDRALQNNQVLVAITGDGKPLDEKQGPMRIVVPQDKRPARSVRMVTTIAVRRAP